MNFYHGVNPYLTTLEYINKNTDRNSNERISVGFSFLCFQKWLNCVTWLSLVLTTLHKEKEEAIKYRGRKNRPRIILRRLKYMDKTGFNMGNVNNPRNIQEEIYELINK